MKILVLIGVLAVLSVAASHLTEDRDLDLHTSQYLQYLRRRSQLEKSKRVFNDFCPGKDDEFDEALLQMSECANQVDFNKETTCSIVRNNFLRCTKPMNELLSECLPEKSKEVPSLLVKMIHSGAAYICKTDGEHILELANSCISKMNVRSMRCERKIKAKLQQYKNTSPSKTEICETLQSMKPCLHNHLMDSCGHTITRESFMGMFEAISAPCNFPTNQVGGATGSSLNEVEILYK